VTPCAANSLRYRRTQCTTMRRITAKRAELRAPPRRAGSRTPQRRAWQPTLRPHAVAACSRSCRPTYTPDSQRRTGGPPVGVPDGSMPSECACAQHSAQPSAARPMSRHVKADSSHSITVRRAVRCRRGRCSLRRARTSSARYCVICVVLPDPVSPITTSICSGSHDSAAQPSATLRRHTRTAVGADHNS
jgi:hypothetical protein